MINYHNTFTGYNVTPKMIVKGKGKIQNSMVYYDQNCV